MEFKEFSKEAQRICNYHLYDEGCCGECPLNPFTNDKIRCLENVIYHPDEAERIVREWVKEHPIVTNKDKFLEVFGDIGNGEFEATCEWRGKEYQPPRKENADEKGRINHKMAKS